MEERNMSPHQMTEDKTKKLLENEEATGGRGKYVSTLLQKHKLIY